MKTNCRFYLFIGICYRKSTFTDYHIGIQKAVFYNGFCNGITDNDTALESLFDLNITESFIFFCDYFLDIRILLLLGILLQFLKLFFDLGNIGSFQSLKAGNSFFIDDAVVSRMGMHIKLGNPSGKDDYSRDYSKQHF